MLCILSYHSPLPPLSPIHFPSIFTQYCILFFFKTKQDQFVRLRYSRLCSIPLELPLTRAYILRESSSSLSEQVLRGVKRCLSKRRDEFSTGSEVKQKKSKKLPSSNFVCRLLPEGVAQISSEPFYLKHPNKEIHYSCVSCLCFS